MGDGKPSPYVWFGANSLIVVALAFARCDHHVAPVALTVDAEQRLALCLCGQAVKVLNCVDRMAVDAFNNITLLQV